MLIIISNVANKLTIVNCLNPSVVELMKIIKFLLRVITITYPTVIISDYNAKKIVE